MTIHQLILLTLTTALTIGLISLLLLKMGNLL